MLIAGEVLRRAPAPRVSARILRFERRPGLYMGTLPARPSPNQNLRRAKLSRLQNLADTLVRQPEQFAGIPQAQVLRDGTCSIERLGPKLLGLGAALLESLHGRAELTRQAGSPTIPTRALAS